MWVDNHLLKTIQVMDKEEIEVLNELLDREVSNLVNVSNRVRNNGSFKKKIVFLLGIKKKLNQNKDE
jgi:hypothetical protein